MAKSKEPDKKRTKVSQDEIPAFTLEEALRVVTAIYDNFGKNPAPPMRVASAMNLLPNSTRFRMLCGAATAFGLTVGGAFTETISLTPLSLRIARPTAEGDDVIAKREAFLKPRLISEFLSRYNNSPVPRADIARNILADMGLPDDRTENALTVILDGAMKLGLTHEIKGKSYVDLQGAHVASETPKTSPDESRASATTNPESPSLPPAAHEGAAAPPPPSVRDSSKKVFITHGKSRELVEPIKQLLQFGEMEAVVSVERQSVSQPVPDKVMDEMRMCGAAIIHVADELHLIDKDAKEHVILNPNVLIEIGAAMALYGRRFILLVKDGVKLPSNLQGLYEVRYEGESLDGNATIRLLHAINELKKQQPPTAGL